MDKTKKPDNIVIHVGPSVNPYAKIFRTERRLGLRDRRRLITYIDKDRRGGIADRRDLKRFHHLGGEDSPHIHSISE